MKDAESRKYIIQPVDQLSERRVPQWLFDYFQSMEKKNTASKNIFHGQKVQEICFFQQ